MICFDSRYPLLNPQNATIYYILLRYFLVSMNYLTDACFVPVLSGGGTAASNPHSFFQPRPTSFLIKTRDYQLIGQKISFHRLETAVLTVE
jgi:hypothetical protein